MSEYKEDVIFNYSIFHFVESKDLADAAVRSALQSEDLVSRQKLVCSTPLIVQGEVIKSAGVITDDDRYIYTVYTFLVTNVLRSSPGINVNVNDQIEITSWGGVVKNDARTLTYLHSTIRQLNVNSQYLLYLKNDQEAGDYYLFDAAGIYQLDDGLVIRMDTLLDPIFAQRARAAEVPTTGAGIKAEIASTTCGK
jgi:hypothetical protein